MPAVSKKPTAATTGKKQAQPPAPKGGKKVVKNASPPPPVDGGQGQGRQAANRPGAVRGAPRGKAAAKKSKTLVAKRMRGGPKLPVTQDDVFGYLLLRCGALPMFLNPGVASAPGAPQHRRRRQIAAVEADTAAAANLGAQQQPQEDQKRTEEQQQRDQRRKERDCVLASLHNLDALHCIGDSNTSASTMDAKAAYGLGVSSALVDTLFGRDLLHNTLLGSERNANRTCNDFNNNKERKQQDQEGVVCVQRTTDVSHVVPSTVHHHHDGHHNHLITTTDDGEQQQEEGAAGDGTRSATGAAPAAEEEGEEDDAPLGCLFLTDESLPVSRWSLGQGLAPHLYNQQHHSSSSSSATTITSSSLTTPGSAAAGDHSYLQGLVALGQRGILDLMAAPPPPAGGIY